MKDAKQLVNLFLAKGFTLHRQSNHLIWNCPCGHTQVTSPASPRGGRRSIENTQALIKRTLRVCTTNQEDA